MKFLIAFAFLAVVSALPPGHGFGHRQHEDHQIDGPISQNKQEQVNLIKLVYKQLIESLNQPAQDENEEEERAINDIVDTINIIGRIIHDKIIDGEDNNDNNSPPKLQHPEHNDQEGDVPNSPPGSVNIVPLNDQDEYKKVPFTYGSKDEVISVVDELPADDESESSELSIVDNVFEDGEGEHVLSFVNQQDDEENHVMVYNSNVVNEPAL